MTCGGIVVWCFIRRYFGIVSIITMVQPMTLVQDAIH